MKKTTSQFVFPYSEKGSSPTFQNPSESHVFRLVPDYFVVNGTYNKEKANQGSQISHVANYGNGAEACPPMWDLVDSRY